MERSWWWKAIGILFLVILAVVYLTPSTPGIEGVLPKWYTKLIKSRLQLGLDLQGGIYLVYTVNIRKAIEDKADRLAADIEDRLKTDKKFKITKLKMIRGSAPYVQQRISQGLDKAKYKVTETDEVRDRVLVYFPNKADIKAMDKKFVDGYRYKLVEVERDEAKGFIHLRMDEEEAKEVEKYAIQQGIETIRNRIDEFGVSEPSIRAKGRDIIVELPGLNDDEFERVQKLIGRTAQLEFKMVDDKSDFMQKVAEKLPKDHKRIKVESDSYDGKKNGLVRYSFLKAEQEMITEGKDRGRDHGKLALQEFLSRENLEKLGLRVPEDHEIALELQTSRAEKGQAPKAWWVTHYLFRRAELTGETLRDAEPQWDQRTGHPEVGLTFNHEGARLFERLSGENIGARMAIMLDNKVNSAPVFQDRIGGGRARITMGGWNAQSKLKEVNDLVAVLRAGALPAPLDLMTKTQIGATLGRDAVERGSLAFGIGLTMVVLFMLYYYRIAGIICDIALTLNFLFIMAILSAFNATLTLPGIAGLVLTIGMAVDANVIIYERIREELRLGKSPRAAVDAGYSRAFWTIFDAQVTTAIAAFVLMQWGTGPIRGFAVTLLAGIICSIFTGVVVSRVMFDLIVAKFRPKSLSI